MDLYNRRETVDKESYLASFDDIEKNDFNLNIPRYVDNFEKEEEVDINGLLADMQKTDDEIGKVEGEVVNLLKDLTSSDENIMVSLNRYIDMIEGCFVWKIQRLDLKGLLRIGNSVSWGNLVH